MKLVGDAVLRLSPNSRGVASTGIRQRKFLASQRGGITGDETSNSDRRGRETLVESLAKEGDSGYIDWAVLQRCGWCDSVLL